MEQSKKDEIYNAIEVLKKLAKETDSEMVCLFAEKDDAKGRHIALWGNGKKIKNLFIDSFKDEPMFLMVVENAIHETKPKNVTQ